MLRNGPGEGLEQGWEEEGLAVPLMDPIPAKGHRAGKAQALVAET